MSLYSALNTSVTGMNAQANKISVISENISNSSTVGYKQGSAQFEDLISQVTTGDYNAIGVTTTIRYDITGQGSLNATTSNTDLAIQGNGFFVVQGTDNGTYLTRAGSFTKDVNGNLVNSAGYKLMAYPYATGITGSAGDMKAVNLNPPGTGAAATTSGTMTANLPSTADALTGTPSPTNYSKLTSVTTYDNLGAAQTLNTYYSKTGPNTWEVDVYNSANLSGSPATTTLTFDPNTGALQAASAGPPAVAASPTSITIPASVTGGKDVTLDLSSMTQLATNFAVTTSTANGSAPSSVKDVSIAADGTLSFVYANGSEVPAFTIALANVESPDHLTNLSGDVFQENSESGAIVIGAPGTGGLGQVKSSNLEASTVDLAGQLTDMIQAQRGYEANSKVFQAGSDLLSELINILK